MDHLDEISVEELQDALDNVEGKKPIERLLAAISYKNCVTQSELAEWHDVQRRTIYSWLERPEEVGLDAPSWTPALVQDYRADTYDVAYSIPSCRRLLKETIELSETTPLSR